MKPLIVCSREWVRYGGARCNRLPVRTHLLSIYLQKKLPKEYGPYRLYSSVFKSSPKAPLYFNIIEEIGFSQLANTAYSGVVQFFIVSSKISPCLYLDNLTVATEDIFLSGIIGLQVLPNRFSEGGCANLEMVPKVKHRETQEIREHKDYLEIYRSVINR
ncbi:hypothetical protein [Pleionea sp. CnH1-48]|uniref:hypothetical protein n=1 Tax=Pleionea sp. CnH1-48 TaxID=2954494 RepID=UPI0020974F61|nr:hypothetical protein [Pleionea sp. CnH1-48]MCO7227570.1 hypothetical protein [Pleionea sp. CnH1-48]